MNPPAPQSPKLYYLHQEGAERGPFTLPQLNQMRSRNEIAATDLCRPADSAEFLPLGTTFPHMAEFVRKSPEELKKQARAWEGDYQAKAALVCGVLCWVIFGPVLSVFAIVLGVKSWIKIQSAMGLVGALLGAASLIIMAIYYLRPGLH